MLLPLIKSPVMAGKYFKYTTIIYIHTVTIYIHKYRHIAIYIYIEKLLDLIEDFLFLLYINFFQPEHNIFVFYI